MRFHESKQIFMSDIWHARNNSQFYDSNIYLQISVNML